MPKKKGSGGAHCTTRQKGLRNKGGKRQGTYSREEKRKNADRYGVWKEGVQVR